MNAHRKISGEGQEHRSCCRAVPSENTKVIGGWIGADVWETRGAPGFIRDGRQRLH